MTPSPQQAAAGGESLTGGESPTRADVWLAELSPGEDVRAWALLDQAERERAGRFRSAADRWAYVSAHAQLRRILGRFLHEDPGRLSINRTCLICGDRAHGKPRLDGGAGMAGPSFNMARRGLLGLYVVAAAGVEVGIDLELVSNGPWERIESAYLSPSERSALQAAAAGGAGGKPEVLQASEDRRRASLWVRKEACLKALGRGLATDPRRCEVGIERAGGTGGTDAGSAWTPVVFEDGPVIHVRDLDVTEGYVAAVAAALPLAIHEASFWRS